MAFAQGDTVSSGNTQDADINQGASAGGNADNQAAIVQQNAGDDANATVNQSQNLQAGGVVSGRGGHVHGVRGVVGGGHVHGAGVRGVGGGVGGVTLARTGFRCLDPGPDRRCRARRRPRPPRGPASWAADALSRLHAVPGEGRLQGARFWVTCPPVYLEQEE
jgi:hypothetical protein